MIDLLEMIKEETLEILVYLNLKLGLKMFFYSGIISYLEDFLWNLSWFHSIDIILGQIEATLQGLFTAAVNVTCM